MHLPKLTSLLVGKKFIEFLEETRERIVTGGHGAGLTNMIFSKANATVIELPMKPHVDRCYGYMAMALGLDYWILPHISAPYFGRFNVDKKGANALGNLVEHVLKSKGLGHLLRNGDDEL